MEMWKPIPGYEGYYEASTYGRIRTARNRTIYNPRYGYAKQKQRILKTQYQMRKGSAHKDEKITLHVDNEIKTFLVARLIAMTWCNGYNERLEVNHIDGNPSNNRSDNLEWVSRCKNIQHALTNNLIHTRKPICLIDKNGDNRTFESMKEASLYLGKEQQYISMMLRLGRTSTPDGYTIKRME